MRPGTRVDRDTIPPKTCPGCDQTFRIRRTEYPGAFAKRRHCSHSCGNSRGTRRALLDARPTRRAYDAEQLGWRHQARCATGPGPEFFFAPDYERGPERAARERRALDVCADCPVRRECLTWALGNNEQGVWGGTTRADREEMARARRGGDRRPAKPRSARVAQ